MRGAVFYTFPDCHALANASEEDIKACGAGYRAAYIKSAAQAVCDGFDLEALKKLPYAEAKKQLTGIKGVGKKSSGLHFYCIRSGLRKAFPLDVWTRRAIFNMYGYCGKNEQDMNEYIASKFGEHAGLAQQYLFPLREKKQVGAFEGSLFKETSRGFINRFHIEEKQ